MHALKKFRLSRNQCNTITEFSALLGISTNALWRIETGAVRPSCRMTATVARTLKVDYADALDFLRGAKIPKPVAKSIAVATRGKK